MMKKKRVPFSIPHATTDFFFFTPSLSLSLSFPLLAFFDLRLLPEKKLNCKVCRKTKRKPGDENLWKSIGLEEGREVGKKRINRSLTLT